MKITDTPAETTATWTSTLDALLAGDRARIAAEAGDPSIDPTNRPTAGAPARNQFGTFKVIQASVAQKRFLTTLFEERDASKADTVAAALLAQAGTDLDADAISKKVASSAIEALLALPKIAADGTSTPVRAGKPASEKQVALIAKLASERSLDAALLARTQDADLTSREASEVIDALFAAPKAKSTKAPVEAGMYRTADGTIYRAYLGQQSGKILAKRVVVTPAEGDEPARVEFEYAGKADRFVTPADRMTLEQAKEFGHTWGHCCLCGRLLTVPESVDAGVGPVCINKI